MSEKFEVPSAANDNSAPAETVEQSETLANAEALKEAIEIRNELERYNGKTYTDVETQNKVEALAAALAEKVESEEFTVEQIIQNDLGWSPYVQLLKDADRGDLKSYEEAVQAANENRSREQKQAA